MRTPNTLQGSGYRWWRIHRATVSLGLDDIQRHSGTVQARGQLSGSGQKSISKMVRLCANGVFGAESLESTACSRMALHGVSGGRALHTCTCPSCFL